MENPPDCRVRARALAAHATVKQSGEVRRPRDCPVGHPEVERSCALTSPNAPACPGDGGGPTLAAVERAMQGFHQDAEGHWVAELACGFTRRTCGTSRHSHCGRG